MSVHGSEPVQIKLLVNITLGIVFGCVGLNAFINGYFDLGKSKVTRYYRGKRPFIFWSLVIGCLLFSLSCAFSVSAFSH